MDPSFLGLDSPPYTPPSVHEEIEVHHENAKEDETASQEEGADLQTPQPDSHTLTSSVEAVAKSGSTASIYLDDGLSEDPQPSKTPQPPRRLTMAQRAAMEALASFGGTDLSSMQVKKRDLKTELKRDAEKLREEEKEEGEDKQVETRKTRLQAAKEEAVAAKEEAVAAFENTALGERTGKNRRGVLPNARKTTSKGGSGREMKHVTRAQRAKCEAYESFGGASLDSLPVRRKRKMENTATDSPPAKAPRHLTRVELARLEALQSFGGEGLSDVMSESKRRVARTLEAREKGGKGEEPEDEEGKGDKENVLTVDACAGEELHS